MAANTSNRRTRNRFPADQRREEILRATHGLVLKLGFAATRITDVATVLGVSTGLIHYHFSSKDELLSETLRFAADLDLLRLEQTVAEGRDPIERIDRTLREYLPGPSDVSWTLWIDAWGEALRNPKLRAISQELDSTWVNVMERVIVEGVADGTFFCAQPGDAAWRIASMLDGLGLQVVMHSTMDSATMLEHARTHTALELGIPRHAFPAPKRRSPTRAD